MTFLGIDTSTPKIVISLEKDGNVLYLSYRGVEKHAVKLAPLMKTALDTLGVDLFDVELLGLGIGPGNLTGLRIGVSTVLGIASVTGVRIVPMNSLELISLNLPFDVKKVVVRKARKGFVYSQVFEGSETLEGPRVYSVDELSKILEKLGDYVLMGDGAELFEGEKAPETLWYPTAEVLLHEMKRRSDRAVPHWEITPLYVQKSIAELNLERRKRGGV